MNDFTRIKNIIFDLGAVIIPIDFEKTFDAFALLSKLPKESVKKKYADSSFFVDFEKGLIGNFSFLQQLRALLGVDKTVTDQQLIDAWNTLLLPIPKERIARIQALASKYRLFLLSNTNPIHIHEVQRILYTSAQVDCLERLFEHTWYSYDLGLIKPHTSIYEKVLKRKSLLPHETLFLDDNKDNIEGAARVGIQTVHVTEHSTFLELLKHA
jgi:epoxide hydrolase-like predicted phosphatase